MVTHVAQMSAAPKVSVVIPCYNHGRYLDEAVESVLAQTYQDFEILILNDGSTDEATRRLLRTYSRPKTTVFEAENRGLAGARNFLVEKARGDYLCALDADDRLEPTYLEKTVRILEADPTVTFVSSWLRTFDEEAWVWKQERCDLPTLLAEDTVHTAALVRAPAVREVGGYDTAMPEQGYEDWDLWIRLVERGGRGVIIPEVLFHYRRRKDSMSAVCTQGDAHVALTRYLVEKHKASYERHLFDVLLRREADIGDLLCQNDELERHIHGRLEPEIERRKEELARLKGKLAGPLPPRPVPQSAWRTALTDRKVPPESAQDEAKALRASWSWRLTAPLRAAHSLLTRRRGST